VQTTVCASWNLCLRLRLSIHVHPLQGVIGRAPFSKPKSVHTAKKTMTVLI